MHYKSCGNELRKGTPEEESLQASSKNRHRGCRRDVLRQVRAAATICIQSVNPSVTLMLLADRGDGRLPVESLAKSPHVSPNSSLEFK